jgi:glucosamine--fructose-6-phosphate aminotransferase (isomerizing)
VHNAHPHFSHGSGAASQAKPGKVALVHNGIIENYEELRAGLKAKGYVFESQTDTEVIVHLMDSLYDGDLFEALKATVAQLHGAYAIAAFCKDEPHRVVGARAGSPLILGVGKDKSENFLASDAMALAGVTDQIVYLEEGDMVDIQLGKYWIVGKDGKPAQREVKTVQAHSGAAELGPYRHYMQKEIFEQPRAIADTLEGVEGIVPELFGDQAFRVFKEIDSVLILACGTSYYSGCAAKYWLESIAGIPTQVEVASEYRYRTSVPNPKTLVVTITQSGETADTLAALRHAQSLGMTQTLTICNVSTSAMVRECKLAYITRAGVEIGVASTKAFTTQLAGLFLLTLALAQSKGKLTRKKKPATSKPCATCPPPCKPCSRWSPKSSAGPKTSPKWKTRSSSAAACITPSPWKAHSSSKRSATSTPRPTPQANSNTAPWPWSPAPCPSSASHPTTRCSKNSKAICRKSAPAAASSTSSPTPTATSKAAKACT